MTRRIQLGSGPNRLPDPWENYDSEVDIRNPLPFPAGSAAFILAEHVIEHVEFHQGLYFLTECIRVLQPGGVLRLAFPDITREINFKEYRESFAVHHSRKLVDGRDVWLSILNDWGHKSCWTLGMAERVVMAVGFRNAYARECGRSPHAELMNMVDLIPRSETSVVEATR